VNITPQIDQLTLDFEPGLSSKHRNLRDCIATSIYRRGLSSVAIDLNESPGNLGNQLSDDSQRKFGVDELELYLEKSGDFSPIFYLIDKFLHDKTQKQNAALSQLAPILQQLAPLLKQAGLTA
jgi:hypothetical protein